jgi:hypothetical protein
MQVCCQIDVCLSVCVHKIPTKASAAHMLLPVLLSCSIEPGVEVEVTIADV